jgi:recombination protein RecR
MPDSRSVEQLQISLQRLPGVGPKSAQRMAFHLLERDRKGAYSIADAIKAALSKVNHCQRCNNFSENTLCSICASKRRDSAILCIAETPADVEAIELASAYKGMYFVLMGHLSPLDGIGPEQLGITRMLDLIRTDTIDEVILATNLTLEGEATADYIADLLHEQSVTVTRLARGVPVGGELEYMDAGTLNQAFSDRRKI